MKFLFTLLLTVHVALGVLPQTAVWEFRQAATAGNVNGGFFNAARGGVDYTLQNAAQLTQTDGAAAGTTTFSSVLGGFTAQMVGNGLHITASTGLTVGWYEIVTFTDANNVELDRTPGTGTATTFFVGGALGLASTLDDDCFEAMVFGNIGYLKFSSTRFTLGEGLSITSASASAGTNIFLIGYDSDRNTEPAAANRPVLDMGSGSQLFPANWQFQSLQITGTGAPTLTTGAGARISNCKIYNVGTNTTLRGALQVGAGSSVYRSELFALNGYALQTGNSADVLVSGCLIHSSEIGFNPGNASGTTLEFSILYGHRTAHYTTAAINTARNSILNCTFHGANATPRGIGARTTGVTSALRIRNSIFHGLATGVEIATLLQDSNIEDWNDFSNCTTPRTLINIGANSITTAPSFAGVTQIVVTDGTAAPNGAVITSATADFTSVTDGIDTVAVISGSGSGTASVLTQNFLIIAHTSTTLTLQNQVMNSGTGTGSSIVAVVYTGHNFLPTAASLPGYPGAFNSNASETTGSLTMGAVQKSSSGGSEQSHVF